MFFLVRIYYSSVTYLTLSETISGLEFLLARVIACGTACVGLAEGSDEADGGEQDPELERLKALERTSTTAGVRPDRARLRLFFSSSALIIAPGGAQSKSFFKCPRPHRQPQALNAKS